MKNIFLFASALVITISSYAQVAQGDIETYMSDVISDMPGNSGSDYDEPSIEERDDWDSVIGLILNDNIADARTEADLLNYQVTEFTDTSIQPNQTFYVLEEKSPQIHYWGTYVFNPSPLRETLILQAPHSKYDTNTGKEAVHCFKNNLAKAVFINGTHRCNHNDPSPCSGQTSACNSTKQDFRISDMAHTVTSMFQKTTEHVFDNVPNSVFIQLHGFGKDDDDPYVIMSNGTRETPQIDYALQIKNALFDEDNSLTFKLVHIDLEWDRLKGFTNTQGRFVNGSPDACDDSAETTTGRFIHIEQEKSKLREDVTGWIKMSNALAEVFPVGQTDSDNDGVPDSLDQCPGLDDALIGTSCDDGDDCTENDVYDDNCACSGTYTDNDEDGLCVGDDPDDNDPCNPNACNPCDVIISDSFEDNYGNWNDGGSDASRTTSYPNSGAYSVRLRDNSSSSKITTDALDLSTYDEVSVNFSYYPWSMEDDEDFFFEISTDGGDSYDIYRSWVKGIDFSNKNRYNESVNIADINFTNTTKFRFRCDASSNNDKVYLDDIVIEACIAINKSETSIVKPETKDKAEPLITKSEFKIFPNPVKNRAFIKSDLFLKESTQIKIYSINGVVVKQIATRPNGNSTTQMNLQDLANGLYIMTIVSKDGALLKNQKIIVD